MPNPLAVEIALSEDEREVVCPSCPTGALSATGPAGKSLALSFDPSACPACGACASACPEGAVSLRRVIASSSLSAGRQAITEVVSEDRCLSCGKPLAGGRVARAFADQLAASHPQIASRLRNEDRRTDCLLAAGHAYGRPQGARS
jgi:ferredoxin